MTTQSDTDKAIKSIVGMVLDLEATGSIVATHGKVAKILEPIAFALRRLNEREILLFKKADASCSPKPLAAFDEGDKVRAKTAALSRSGLWVYHATNLVVTAVSQDPLDQHSMECSWISASGNHLVGWFCARDLERVPCLATPDETDRTLAERDALTALDAQTRNVARLTIERDQALLAAAVATRERDAARRERDEALLAMPMVVPVTTASTMTDSALFSAETKTVEPPADPPTIPAAYELWRENTSYALVNSGDLNQDDIRDAITDAFERGREFAELHHESRDTALAEIRSWLVGQIRYREDRTGDRHLVELMGIQVKKIDAATTGTKRMMPNGGVQPW